MGLCQTSVFFSVYTSVHDPVSAPCDDGFTCVKVFSCEPRILLILTVGITTFPYCLTTPPAVCTSFSTGSNCYTAATF